MQSGEVRVKNSSSNFSLLSSLFENDDGGGDLVEKKRKIDRDCEEKVLIRPQTVPFSSLFASSSSSAALTTTTTAAAAAAESAPSMYFVPRGGETEAVNGGAEQGVPAVAPFPVFNSQQGFVRFGSELAPVFPGLNSSWSPQAVGNPYQYCCFPYNNLCVPSAVAPNLNQKVDGPWNSLSPQQMESVFGHNSVLHAGFVPFQAMFQNPFFPASLGGPVLNPSLASLHTKSQELDVCATSRGPRDDYPFAPKPVRGHLLNFPPPAPLTKNEELNVCATSQGQEDDNPLDVSVPSHKRKMGSPGYLGNTSIAAPMERNDAANLESSAANVIPIWLEQSAVEATQNVRPSLVSSSVDHQSRHSTATNSYSLEEDKDTKGKDWVLLVQKELRNTDVGNLGRIVLPKKDAEANLPQLVTKDGLILQMEDMTFSIKWRFKYRYWPNNKSRMYVMENTGDFVRTHNLQTGDFFIVYKDKNSGKYIAHGKKGMKSSDLGDAGRQQEGETDAKDKLFTRQSCVPANAKQDVNAENCAFATREPLHFGGSSHFIKPL